jgi:AbrB family looped-hinge helix DNA binding protein
METIATTKGQVVIPFEVRRKLGIEAGTRIEVEMDEMTGQIILTPITPEYIHSLRGKYKGKNLLQALADEKAREKAAG